VTDLKGITASSEESAVAKKEDSLHDPNSLVRNFFPRVLFLKKSINFCIFR